MVLPMFKYGIHHRGMEPRQLHREASDIAKPEIIRDLHKQGGSLYRQARPVSLFDRFERLAHF